jgi:hypothetical protein
MSKEYKGTGTLSHLVKEENIRKDRSKQILESGEYFKNHPFQARDDKNHDVDFKTAPSTNSKCKNIDDQTLSKKVKDVCDSMKTKYAPENEEKKSFADDTLYSKKQTSKSENEKTKEDSSKNIDLKCYGENWYETLKGYMKKV